MNRGTTRKNRELEKFILEYWRKYTDQRIARIYSAEYGSDECSAHRVRYLRQRMGLSRDSKHLRKMYDDVIAGEHNFNSKSTKGITREGEYY